MMTAIDKILNKEQLADLERFGRKVCVLGCNFAVCNSDGTFILSTSADSGFLSDWKTIFEKCNIVFDKSKNSPQEQLKVADGRILSIVIRWKDFDAGLAAIIDIGEDGAAQNNTGGPVENGQTAGNVNLNKREILSEMLILLAQRFQSEQTACRHSEAFSSELTQVYEELVLIHKLSANMKVSNSDAIYLQMACDNLTDIVKVEGIAVLLERNVGEETEMVLTAGSGIIEIDPAMKETLQGRLFGELERGREVLLDSEVDGPFAYAWPEYIKSIIAVPLYGKNTNGTKVPVRMLDGNCIIGIMVAINRIGKKDFDSADVKLFNSVANGCAVFIENGRLFGDLKELFIGSLKALTNSIDAKDQYTRGHSERVAFIAKWIAERYSEQENLDEAEIYNIYLSGLLHDIGKIGIDESVIRKKGKLTDEEFKCIRMHPVIGAGILSEIKQMKEIVPGVLHHHERVDGRGYPHGLSGDMIPLMGKIVGLADGFDAMTSERTYRSAMTLNQALDEIRKGMGSQFDEKVARVFLNSDVYHLWDMIKDGLGETYQLGEFAGYGSRAVGALVK